jgi:hypothetical protein
MERKKIVAALTNVQPAISVTNAAEVMKHYWFTGKRVMAFDGGMALAVPFESEWQGAIQSTILPLLNSSGASEVTFEDTEKGFVVKAGASKFKLNTMASTDFNFKIPKMPDQASFPVADVPKFLIALKACKRSLGSETSEACFKGVTIIAGEKHLDMFAYDRLTLTHCTVKTKGSPGFDRIVIPTNAVDQLIRITDGATELSMVITEKAMQVRAGNVILWSQLVEEERNPKQFLEQVAEVKSGANSKPLDITHEVFRNKLPAMLERACIISDAAVDSEKTRVTVADNKIFFKSKSTRGVVDDSIMPPKGQEHGDVTLKMPPARVLAGLDLGNLTFTPRATILANKDQSISFYVSGD